jgi:Fe2+ transport system protein FeoA
MKEREEKAAGKCCCPRRGRCRGGGRGAKNRASHLAGRCFSLAQLPIGASARVLRVQPAFRGRKKFADVGIVPGTELVMEAHAPFGGLLRVRVLDSSLSLHRDDAVNVEVKGSEDEKEI